MVKKIIEDIKIKKKEKIKPAISPRIKSKEKSIKRTKRLKSTPQLKGKRKTLGRIPLVLLIITLIIAGGYWISQIFEKASVVINPKEQIFTFDHEQFSISKEVISPMDFEIMIISESDFIDLLLTDSQNVSAKAKGTVDLYNEFSTNSEKIPKGSFLSDQEGKTYETDQSITIPGYKIVEGEIIPGKAQVNISAFLPGDVYNGVGGDFHLNSFKGTTKYEKIYAKAKTSLSGGALGQVYGLNDLAKVKINEIADSSFKDSLFKKAEAQVPPGYILYPNAFNFSYEFNDQTLYPESNAKVVISGNLSVVLLEKENLEKTVIKNYLDKISTKELEQIKILNVENLIFNFVSDDQIINKETTSFAFTLSGEVKALWQPYVEEIKMKLSGMPKNEVLPVFQEDKGVASAVVKIFPPWQAYLPADIIKIKVKID